MMEEIPRPEKGFPFRTVLLALITVQSSVALVSGRELGGVVQELTGQRPIAADIDYFGTLVDSLFLAWAGTTLLAQSGIVKEDPKVSAAKASMNNMETQITLNVGREPGTWMPKEWGASGARLSLPMKVRFAEEVVDVGFPGEESLGVSRYAKKVYCDGGSFIGANGETRVQATGGAWATEPSGIPGASTLNFFIDFPQAAERNDVSLPEGRVFFSGAVWEGKDALPDGMTEGMVDMPDGTKAGIVAGPGGVFLLDNGGCSIKRNDFRNLWGSLGDVMLILGKWSAAEPIPEKKENETPQEKAARERAEDAARGRF